MKLYTSRTSPYARKARILVHELKLGPRVEEIVLTPSTMEQVRRINPLGKVPVLVLNEGSLIIDSPVICEYLNDYGGGKFCPGLGLMSQTNRRWRVQSLAALGDGLADAAVAWSGEARRPEALQDPDRLAHHTAAIARTLDALERASAKFPENPTIGEIAVGCALGYIDFRSVHSGWRDNRPTLAAWFETFSQYPSVAATMPRETI